MEPLEAEYLRRLRGQGHLWHRTCLSSIDGILRDGRIFPVGQIEPSCTQSQNSCARHLGAVSLYDFDTESESRVSEHIFSYKLTGVLIRIRRDVLDSASLLLPEQILKGKHPIDTVPPEIRAKWMVIPAVEAVHIGSLNASAFTGFLWHQYDDKGVPLWHEVELGDESLSALSAIETNWRANTKRDIKERHEREGFNLQELIEQSYNSDKSTKSTSE